jgi:hypothetical protein
MIRLLIQILIASASLLCVYSGATTIGIILMTIVFLIGIIWFPPRWPPRLNSIKE